MPRAMIVTAGLVGLSYLLPLVVSLPVMPEPEGEADGYIAILNLLFLPTFLFSTSNVSYILFVLRI